MDGSNHVLVFQRKAEVLLPLSAGSTMQLVDPLLNLRSGGTGLHLGPCWLEMAQVIGLELARTLRRLGTSGGAWISMVQRSLTLCRC